MCMYTSLVDRTPGAGRHANFSAGVASASATSCSDTCSHSPSYPSQIPSGIFCANAGAASTTTKQIVAKIVFMWLPLGAQYSPVAMRGSESSAGFQPTSWVALPGSRRPISGHARRKPLEGAPRATKATAKINAPTMGVTTCASSRMARIAQTTRRNTRAFFPFIEPPNGN